MKKHLLAAAAALLFAAPAVAADYTIATMATGLNHPWSMAFLPDGRVLITERSGQLRVLDHGKLGSISGVPAVYAKSQGGLFDVVLHPKFAQNGLIYLSYAAGTPAANATHIARAKLVGNALTEVKVIFTVTPTKNTPVHYGGRMVFLPDGTLLMTVGDGFDFREQAQKLDSGLGKIIRITDSGGIPADNPFVNKPGAQKATWSYGHRNEQGLAFDSVTGRVYESEHGPRGGDEINIIARAANYGWPVATHGIDYSGATITPYTTYPGMKDPIVVWVPSIAPSGLAVYRGAMFKDWQGDLITGALAIPQVRRIDIDAAGKVVGEQRIFPEITQRVRDVRVAPDGAIWISTDEDSGKVLRVTPK